MYRKKQRGVWQLLKDQVFKEMKQIISDLKNTQLADGSWDFAFDTGVITDCSMIILLRSLQIDDEELISVLVDRILDKQEEDGTWKLFYDEKEGNLSVTVLAYYALLYSRKISKRSQRLRMARQFILKNGGLHQVDFFTKIILTITGQLEWPRLFSIPVEVLLLPPTFPLNIYDLAIYARANFIPILMMANRRFFIRTSHTPDLSDLKLNRKDSWNDHSREWRSFQSMIFYSIKRLVGTPFELRRLAYQNGEHYMLQRIEPDGTFYSYFSATFFMIFALVSSGYPKDHPIIIRAIKGLKSFQTKIDGKTHIQYTTANIWNTALISYAMQEAGVSSESTVIKKANQYLLSRQHVLYGDWTIHNPNQIPGGWGFSDINTINPDMDDTTAALRSLKKEAIHNRAFWDRGIQWLISMQNDDGGWASFERNIDKFLFTLLPLKDPEKLLLDPSTADLTGRTLEFFGNFTGARKTQRLMKKGVKWLLQNQRRDGSWYGRWGICYIYGTWCAVTGLVAAKVRKNHPAIQKAVKWLYSIQNEDGGWGESCYSDIEKRYIPLSESTRVHTAWALDTLMAAEESITPQMNKAVEFLLMPENKNSWTSSYPKGQGLPGSFYIHYPSYEYIFPLLALSHFIKSMV